MMKMFLFFRFRTGTVRSLLNKNHSLPNLQQNCILLIDSKAKSIKMAPLQKFCRMPVILLTAASPTLRGQVWSPVQIITLTSHNLDLTKTMGKMSVQITFLVKHCRLMQNLPLSFRLLGSDSYKPLLLLGLLRFLNGLFKIRAQLACILFLAFLPDSASPNLQNIAFGIQTVEGVIKVIF